jgi:hypothetical protein
MFSGFVEMAVNLFAAMALSGSIVLTFINFFKMREIQLKIRNIEKDIGGRIKDVEMINRRMDSIIEAYIKNIIKKGK